MIYNSPQRIDVAIIGVQKAGTTSLLRWLGQHPSIRAQQGMEFVYFSDRDFFDAEAFGRLFRAHFPLPSRNPAPLNLIKHVGLLGDEKALRLLREHSPECRLIAVLRDPAERAWSAFWYARSRGIEPETSFEKAVFERPADHFYDPFLRRSTNYLGKGLYTRDLDEVCGIFPKNQLLVLDFQALRSDPQAVCDRIFHFLGVPGHRISVRRENQTRLPRFPWLSRLVFQLKPLGKMLPRRLHRALKAGFKVFNRSKHPAPAMPPFLRTRLREAFRASNELLCEKYGIDYR